jgi:replicative DNA helicase
LAVLMSQQMAEIGVAGIVNTVTDSADAMQNALQHILDVRAGKVQAAKLTGFVDYDKLFGGYRPGSVNILAARTGVGKTAFALNLAENFVKRGESAVIFSLEMPANQLSQRRLAAESRIDSEKITNASELSPAELQRLQAAGKRLAARPFYIEDSASITVSEVRARVNALQRKLEAQNLPPLSLIIIDYIGLIRTDLKNKEFNANLALSQISRDLKTMAMEIGVPLLVLSQLNRSVEGRGDKRPVLSDLRDSGSVEQDADTVTFIYRDEMYDKNSADAGVAELIVAKNRHGKIGSVKLSFHTNHCAFYGLSTL